MTTTRAHATRRFAASLAALTATLALILAGSVSAHAAPLTFVYNAEGTTHIASTGSTIGLGPAALTTDVDLDTGEFSGSMELPGTTTQFKVIGFIPVTADVTFTEAAPVTGSITPHPGGGGYIAAAHASYDIQLSNIKVAGFPTFTGANCRTADPVEIDLSTPQGERFHLFSGGDMAGTYSVGDFKNCGLNTWLINLLIPGSGNTIEVTLADGQVG